jgi:2-polyprenyl-3-methyl-5-hydroxy-6-metoxy-1,4-benzoquinol methylase
MHISDLTGMRYNPLTGEYSLSARDLDVNYFATCRLDQDA